MDIIKRFPDVIGVFHCYSGSAEMAREILDLGWYISFTGSITFNNARKGLETVKMMPQDRIMIETDSPYLSPVPNRGKRNDSRNLPLIAKTVAEARGVSAEEVEAFTLENGKRFFSIA
jgi:TatD DNase family protein